ncbi:hypothetical protein J6590_061000 [Homalodisca vitripennis]|nr:hypothetical protein J6590_061000 [Homalodisca vitripennis]
MTGPAADDKTTRTIVGYKANDCALNEYSRHSTTTVSTKHGKVRLYRYHRSNNTVLQNWQRLGLIEHGQVILYGYHRSNNTGACYKLGSDSRLGLIKVKTTVLTKHGKVILYGYHRSNNTHACYKLGSDSRLGLIKVKTTVLTKHGKVILYGYHRSNNTGACYKLGSDSRLGLIKVKTTVLTKHGQVILYGYHRSNNTHECYKLGSDSHGQVILYGYHRSNKTGACYKLGSDSVSLRLRLRSNKTGACYKLGTDSVSLRKTTVLTTLVVYQCTDRVYINAVPYVLIYYMISDNTPTPTRNDVDAYTDERTFREKKTIINGQQLPATLVTHNRNCDLMRRSATSTSGQQEKQESTKHPHVVCESHLYPHVAIYGIGAVAAVGTFPLLYKRTPDTFIAVDIRNGVEV